MADAWNELQQRGEGVSPEDVTRAPRRGSKSRAAVAEPQRRQSRPSPDPAEEDVDTYGTLVDDEEDVSTVGDTDDDDDDDEEDEEEEYDDDAEDITDEVEDDDESDLGPEGDDDDEDEDEEPRARQRQKSKGTRKQKFSKTVERQIQKEVQAQVQRTIQENEALREREAARQKLDHENAQFLTEVLGSNDDLEHWKNIALDTRRPQAERDRAAAIYRGYERNRGFFERYKSGAWAVVQYQQAEADKEVLKRVAQLKGLDPKIVGEGDRAKTLLHAYTTGMAAANEINQKEIAKLQRQIQTLKGVKTNRSDRRGVTGRAPAPASGRGRRASPRAARPDRTRGLLQNERGITADSVVPFPTDELLRSIRNGESTLADYGLDERLPPVGRRRRRA